MKSTPQNHPFFKGRVALHAILRAAGIGSGDQVLLPGYTCVVVPNAINYTGAEPVYLEVEVETGNVDCDLLEAGLGHSWQTEKAKAIIVQHTYGIPCNMDKIWEFAKKHKLLVIEDSCHALGSTWKGRPVGSLGDAAFFSSQWSKPITTGLGGWAVANTPELENRLDAISSEYTVPSTAEALQLELQFLVYSLLNHPHLFWIIQGIYRTLGKLGLAIGSSTSGELSCELPDDYKKGMHSLQQRRLKRLLAQTKETVSVRKKNADLIEEALQDVGLPLVPVPIESVPVFLRYPLYFDNKVDILAEAKRLRIQLGDWFLSPIHPNPDKWELAGYKKGTCPIAEKLSKQAINIPTGSGLNKKEIRRTVSFLAEFGQRSANL
jgi:perosamine synthetase